VQSYPEYQIFNVISWSGLPLTHNGSPCEINLAPNGVYNAGLIIQITMFGANRSASEIRSKYSLGILREFEETDNYTSDM